MLLLSGNCHCACATTDESQQQQQYFTVTTIIKQLMITKILNNIHRFICMLLLLLGLSYVIDPPNRPPWSIEHGSLADHYTIWQTTI